jgi:uncharacterized damage-inducible protein DinB
LEDLRYPAGKYTRPERLTAAEREAAIAELAGLPANLRAAVAGLADAQLDTPYRPGGWTVRQVVHHVPDSHANAYVRFKLGLTEEAPAVRPYEEKLWAELPEAKSAPVEPSLAFLAALHGRWVLALQAVAPEQWERTVVNPETGRYTLDQLLALYAWHSRHHVAHVTELRRREGW